MAMTVLHLLDRADITANVSVRRTFNIHIYLIIASQVGHWTLDNAANNGTFMVELGILLRARDIDFDHEDRRIMCFPHVVNICCQHVIAEFTNIELADAVEQTPQLPAPNSATQQSFEDAVTRDPIAVGRNIVRSLRSSGQRRDNFDEIVKDGNDKGWFLVGVPPQVVKLRPLQLLRDVKTRWDSVYFMIKRLREMRPVSHSDHSSARLILNCSIRLSNTSLPFLSIEMLPCTH